MKPEDARESLLDERQRLRRLQSEVEESGELEVSQQESAGSLTSHDQHQGDAGSHTFEREKQLSIREQLESKLSDVNDALERIESGTYGRCQVCGDEISDDRLRALPATRYCLKHATDDGADRGEVGVRQSDVRA
jgi:RNA polymerase-binding transcription factor DksA